MVGVGLESAPALAQDTGSSTTQLQGVEVTGSHIRRVDTETADPVITLSRAYIQATGSTTVGDLITKLPNVAGGAETTAVNNGGTGETTPGLRGLTAKRTLILLDGRRLLLTNLDAIPINMIDHIEIVKDGASEVYGTDAIGGVINLITRKHFTGFEATATGGISEQGDGVKQQYTGTWGLSSSKGHVVAGVSYTNQDAISTAKRKYSRFFLYQGYNGVQLQGGSGTGANGRYFVPVANEPTGLNCNATADKFRSPSTTPAPPSRPTPRPISTASAPRRTTTSTTTCFNYDQLPEQRLEIFEEAEWKIFDNVSFISSALFHDQNTRLQLAPEPLVPARISAADRGRARTTTTTRLAWPSPMPACVCRPSAIALPPSTPTTTTSPTVSRVPCSTASSGTCRLTYQRETLLTTNQRPGVSARPGAGRRPSINQTTCGSATTGSISGCVPFNMFGTPTAAARPRSLFPTGLHQQDQPSDPRRCQHQRRSVQLVGRHGRRRHGLRVSCGVPEQSARTSSISPTAW